MNPSPDSISVLKTTGGGVLDPHRFALSSKIMLSAIVILFSIVLFILFMHFYVRWHVLHRAARRIRRLRRLIFAGEGQAPSLNHALDPAILNSLPVLLFSMEAGDDEEMECAVCLSEFGEGEKIRWLPRCGHIFHIDCIDMWLSFHASCPICRAAVETVSSADSTPVSDIWSSCERAEVINSSSSDSSTGDVVVEIPVSIIGGLTREAETLGFGLIGKQTLNWTSSRVLLIWRFLIRVMWTNPVDGSGTEPDLEEREEATPPAAPQTQME